jgi:hypothetical protein
MPHGPFLLIAHSPERHGARPMCQILACASSRMFSLIPQQKGPVRDRAFRCEPKRFRLGMILPNVRQLR